MKTIEDQGQKQIKAIQNQEHVKTIKKQDYDAKDSPLILKQKEIFNELLDERLRKITEVDKKVNRDDLIYKCKSKKSSDEEFDKCDNALNLINKIRNGEIRPAKVKNDQTTFKSHLGEIKKGNTKKNQKSKKKTIYNIEMLYKVRNEAIKFYDYYSLMVSEAKNKSTKRTELKTLTPK